MSNQFDKVDGETPEEKTVELPVRISAKFEDFIKSKEQALMFFAYLKSTRCFIAKSDMTEIEKHLDSYRIQGQTTFISTVVLSAFAAFRLRQQHPIFRATYQYDSHQCRFSFVGMVKKYYILPLCVSYILNTTIFLNQFKNNLSNVAQRYDFNVPEFKDAFDEVVVNKKMVIYE